MHICAVKGCNSESGKLKIKFRTFPKEISMLKKWIAATANETLQKVEVGKFGKYKICNLHFSDQYSLRPTFTSTDIPVPTESIPVEVKDIDRIAEGINLIIPTEVEEKKNDKDLFPNLAVAKRKIRIAKEIAKLTSSGKSVVKLEPCKDKELENIKVESKPEKSPVVGSAKVVVDQKSPIFVNNGCKWHKDSKFIRIKASKKEALEKSGKYKIIRELKLIKKVQLDADQKMKYLLNRGNNPNVAGVLPDLGLIKKESNSNLEAKAVLVDSLKQTNDLASSKIPVDANGLNVSISKQDDSKVQKGVDNIENVATMAVVQGDSNGFKQVNVNEADSCKKLQTDTIATDCLVRSEGALDVKAVASSVPIAEKTIDGEAECKSSNDNKISRPPEVGNVNPVSNQTKFIKIKASDVAKIENSGKYKIVRTLAPLSPTMKMKRKINVNKVRRIKLVKSMLLKKHSNIANPNVTVKLAANPEKISEEVKMKITEILSQVSPSKCMKPNASSEKDKTPIPKPVKTFKGLISGTLQSTKLRKCYKLKNVVSVQEEGDPETKMKTEITHLKTRIGRMETEREAKIREMKVVKRRLRYMEKKAKTYKSKADSYREFESFHLLDRQIQSFIRSQLHNAGREKFARMYTQLDKMLACSILNCSRPCYSLLAKTFIMPTATKQLKTFNESIAQQNIKIINDGELIYNINFDMP